MFSKFRNIIQSFSRQRNGSSNSHFPRSENPIDEISLPDRIEMRDAFPEPVQYPILPDHLALEVSYACNLHCMMCPRTFEGVPQEVLPPELFEKVKPWISRFKYIHLAGYGEPLMSPHFLDYVHAVRQAGSRPVVTTNGLLLKGKMARRLLEERIDCISVSIDAGTPETYEAVRGKGTFLKLLDTLRAFRILKEEASSDVFMVWVFILMKSNYRELPQAVEYAAELGFNRIVAKHLECTLTAEGFSEALFDTGYVPPPDPEIIQDLERVKEKSRGIAEGRIDIEIHPYQMGSQGACLVRPITNLFVDYRGNLSSCCYLNVLNTRPYLEPAPEDPGILGNLYQNTLDELIRTKRYSDFQRDWIEGRVPEVCKGCVQLRRMGEQNLFPLKATAST